MTRSENTGLRSIGRHSGGACSRAGGASAPAGCGSRVASRTGGGTDGIVESATRLARGRTVARRRRRHAAGGRCPPPGMSEFAARWIFGDGAAGGIPIAASEPSTHRRSRGPAVVPARAGRGATHAPRRRRASGDPEPVPRGHVEEVAASFRLSRKTASSRRRRPARVSRGPERAAVGLPPRRPHGARRSSAVSTGRAAAQRRCRPYPHRPCSAPSRSAPGAATPPGRDVRVCGAAERGARGAGGTRRRPTAPAASDSPLLRAPVPAGEREAAGARGGAAARPMRETRARSPSAGRRGPRSESRRAEP